jgi:hypothetical protein
VFSLQLIDKAKEAAIVATPKIRPVRVTSKAGAGGRRDYNATLTDKYVMYLHPFQVTDLLNEGPSDHRETTSVSSQGPANPL